MIWQGTQPLVIGSFDDDGKVAEQYTVNFGEEIPPGALALLREAREKGMLYAIPQEDPTDMKEAEARLKQFEDSRH
jgi:hypothetical protein